MPVKIRLMRIGATKRPFYRVVAVDERKKRTGGYLELLGTYNPIVEPKEIILKQDRIDDWIKKGAVMSDGFLRIIGKAPQRPPRKAKKPKEDTPTPAPTPAPAQDIPQEENKVPTEEQVDGDKSSEPVTEGSESSEPISDATESHIEEPVSATPEIEETISDTPEAEPVKTDEVS